MCKIAILRNSFYDRAPLLKLSLEWQEIAELAASYTTHIFIDRSKEGLYLEEEFEIACKNYIRYTQVLDTHHGRTSWFHAVRNLFENFDYSHILSIEDDVIISKDYLRLCAQIAEADPFNRDDIMCFHAGAWEKPKGDPSKIVKSAASSRSILVARNKFYRYFLPHFSDINRQKGSNDLFLSQIKSRFDLKILAPEHNRHGHFGVYGYSANRHHNFQDGRALIFGDKSFEEIYLILREVCCSGQRLVELNKNMNSKYFWDFDANISFDSSKLRYQI